MKDLIERVNALQELCIDLPNPVNLPQIVVVGAQSSGKSSILENIVGAEFLPRGTGMVTRRPLLIQIRPLPGEGEDGSADSAAGYCVFGHAPGQQFALDRVRDEIEQETARILAARPDVSAIPIVLKLHLKDALPLTLIDLPGIIKVKSEAQPDGIVRKIEEIARSYIRNQNTVILAVTPAVTDIASSDGLMLAREVDPHFERTCCVLTKVDLMDPGTDLLSVLQGRLVKVKLGFVPVICRGELSVRGHLSIEQALRREEQFFREHPVYGPSYQQCGMRYLVGRLHQVLQESIAKSVPYLQERLETLLAGTEQKLQELGAPVQEPRQQLMQLIAEFKQELDAKISGTRTGRARHSSREILNGARISYSLDTVFSRYIRQLELFEASDAEVETVILNASGVFGAPNPLQGVAHFVAQAIDKLQPCCLNTALSVQAEMQSMVESILGLPRFARFPKLRQAISRSILSLLKERSGAAAQHISQFLRWNSVYLKKPEPSTRDAASQAPGHHHRDPEPHSPGRAISASKSGPPGELSSLRPTIAEYINYIKEIAIEQVPKIIVFELVHQSQALAQSRLIEELYVAGDPGAVLAEDTATAEQRANLTKSLQSLRQAHQIAKEM